jgi:chemotaxis protein MotB
VGRRRRTSRPAASHERWLVSYADFITLLFAFFTTMYAISTVDAAKLSKMVTSMQVALHGDVPGPPVPGPSSGDRVLPALMPERGTLIELREQLAGRLQRQIENGEVTLTLDRRGLVVSIREAGSFAEGSADLSPQARALLVDVAAPLAEMDALIRVEGHTDDVPISTPRFRSNWELSTARATSVVRYLVEEARIDATRLSAAGYGEFHPRAPNDSATARAQNRRVDLVVLNSATRAAEEPGQAGRT